MVLLIRKRMSSPMILNPGDSAQEKGVLSSDTQTTAIPIFSKGKKKPSRFTSPTENPNLRLPGPQTEHSASKLLQGMTTQNHLLHHFLMTFQHTHTHATVYFYASDALPYHCHLVGTETSWSFTCMPPACIEAPAHVPCLSTSL